MPVPVFGVSTLACFDSFLQVGEGAYGYVYKARDKRVNEIVALKRLIIHKESAGFPLNAVREIKFLKSIQHKNIVSLKEVITSKTCEHLDEQLTRDSFQPNRKDTIISPILQKCGSLFLVFEYVENDLGGLLDAKVELPLPVIKCLMKQLFEALEHLHERKIVHRDIKPANLLVTNHFQLKLADFGLARSIVSCHGVDRNFDLSVNVVTLWYRPPELLVGSQRYNCQVDIWSAGCVLAEMELGRPLFVAKTEYEQLDMIFRLLGLPTEETWSGVTSFPSWQGYLEFAQRHIASRGPIGSPPTGLKAVYGSKLSSSVLSLLERVLVCDPIKRSSAKAALANMFFHSTAKSTVPDPEDLEPLATGLAYHEFQTKKRMKLDQEKQRLVDNKVEKVEDANIVAAFSNTSADHTECATVAQDRDYAPRDRDGPWTGEIDSTSQHPLV